MGHNTKTHRHRQQYGDYQKEGDGGVIKGKADQINGDRRSLNIGW